LPCIAQPGRLSQKKFYRHVIFFRFKTGRLRGFWRRGTVIRMANSIPIADIRARLRGRSASVIEGPTLTQAAVAIVLAEHAGDAHALLIKRTERPGDPWSGHMAFPGGHREPHESDLFLTAARETLEEVGIDLHRQAEPIGRLDDIRAQSNRPLDMLIRPFVCAATEDLTLRLNAAEVHSTLWVPLSALDRDETRGAYRHESEGATMSYPAYVYAGFTIWGLTYRMIQGLLQALRQPL